MLLSSIDYSGSRFNAVISCYIKETRAKWDAPWSSGHMLSNAYVCPLMYVDQHELFMWQERKWWAYLSRNAPRISLYICITSYKCNIQMADILMTIAEWSCSFGFLLLFPCLPISSSSSFLFMQWAWKQVKQRLKSQPITSMLPMNHRKTLNGKSHQMVVYKLGWWSLDHFVWADAIT